MKNKILNTVLILVLLVFIVAGGYFGFQMIYKKAPTTTTNSTGMPVHHSLTITKTDMDIELEDIQAVLMSAKATPFRNEGDEKIIGFQITEIQPNSFWTKFGFQDGDVLTHVNDVPMDTPSSGMSIYTTLRSETRLEFKIIRNSESGILELNIKQD